MKKYITKNATRLIVLLLAASPFLAKAQDEKISYQRPSYWRPYDQKGINVFETSKKEDSIKFDGLRVRFGADFTQGFQSLKHSNTADDKNGANKLYALTSGFNTAMANLNMDVQLADGIRLNMVTYLSTRHHNEAWVKGGYLQFDKLPLKGKIWDDIMKVTTLKLGHMEINYGDAHFRRSDGGNSIYNTFAENYILDAFATEIGGEVYVHKNGLFGMVGVTNGLIKGNVDSLAKTEQDQNGSKSASVYLKAGIDKNLSDKIRVRFAASYYHNGSSAGNTLYGGDRAGSNYFMVMEKAGTGVTYATNAFSGRINPGFSKKIDAFQLNGLLKVGGLELFGTYENGKGRSKIETDSRTIHQLAGDVIYRFGKTENIFLGARYNTVKGELTGITNDVTVSRVAVSGGWFLTKNILLKGEIVNQKYYHFPSSDYRNGGKFYGYVIQAAVGF
ncbi:MAG TPA: hypothetical protein VN958_02860 [Chitinophagaceae bacterium]|nr:hypothetical protein [Chitinophagaceae bacterium]